MEFRLIYTGTLPAASVKNKRRNEKHQIRQVLHRQLVELWHKHPFLRLYIGGRVPKRKPDGELVSTMYYMAERYPRGGYLFLPLLRILPRVVCSLDILFLRRDRAGSVISSGDIDNRIKVLFDALRLPTTDEVRGFSPEQDEVPFLCLLEDDSLITELKVTTDRLLTPPTGSSNHIGSDVHLVIHVKTDVVDRGREWQL